MKNPARTKNWLAADFSVMRDDGMLCTLCPHACVLDDGDEGICRVRRRTGGTMETAGYATSVFHLDSVERKPLYHYRPGRRVLTLAVPGCTFHCHYCQNHRISQYGRSDESPWGAEPVEPEEVLARAVSERAAIGFSYSEPTLCAELTLELAREGRPLGVEVIWKSNGFLSAVALERIAPSLAAVNIDVKAADEAAHRRLTGAALAPVLDSVEAFLASGTWVEVSVPLIPGVNDDRRSIEAITRRVHAWGAGIPLHFLRFNPDFRMSSADPTSPRALHEARERALDLGLHYVYVERALESEGRDTRCPSCGHRIVERGIWETKSVDLVNGLCPQCSRRIPGVWKGASE